MAVLCRQNNACDNSVTNSASEKCSPQHGYLASALRRPSDKINLKYLKIINTTYSINFQQNAAILTTHIFIPHHSMNSENTK